MLLLGKTVEFICHLPVSVSYLHTLEHPTAHYISDADGSIEGKVVVVVNTSLERDRSFRFSGMEGGTHIFGWSKLRKYKVPWYILT